MGRVAIGSRPPSSASFKVNGSSPQRPCSNGRCRWQACENRIIVAGVRMTVEAILIGWVAFAGLVFFIGCGHGTANVAVGDGGDLFAALRQRMVREQLSGTGRAITNAAVLAAMEKVPRHEFVPAPLRPRAYEDCPLPIGYDQTISQPYIVAFMTEQLRPQPADRVLEIGTGSGYQAAVFAELVQAVYTIEIIEPLAHRAEADLKRLGYTNVFVRAGDGYQGWREAAPFDAIIVTCAPESVPSPLVTQLREGGRMIIPVGPAGNQELVLLTKRGDRLERRAVLPVRFVPMTGEAQSPSGPRTPKPE